MAIISRIIWDIKNWILFLISVVLMTLINGCNEKPKLNIDQFSQEEQILLRRVLTKNDSIFYSINSNFRSTLIEYLQFLKKTDNSDQLADNRFFKDTSLCKKFESTRILSRNQGWSNYEGLKKEVWLYTLPTESPYYHYLNLIGEENEVIRKYSKSLRRSGGPSPNSTATLIYELSEHDLSDPNIRLILGLHFLLMYCEDANFIE